ncbi:unnamed protein product [Scytosiphon promiscuus]
MARPAPRRSSRSQGSESSPQPPTARSRKRNAKEEPEEQEDHTQEEEEEEQPRRLKQSRSSNGNAAGGGGSGSGSGGGGSGSGSSSRRSSGFQNIQSQSAGQEDDEDDEGEGEQFSFSQTQNAARSKMVKAAREPSKEVQIEEKDERRGNELSVTEQKELIKKMMRYLLMKGLNHEPVTKKEMMDDVLGSHFRKAGVLKYILTKADQRLQQGTGFKVTTLVASKACFVKDTYYVVNVLDNEDHFREILRGSGKVERGLLMLVLSVIFCSSDKSASEDQLFKKLHDHIDKRVPEKAWHGNNPKNKNKVHVDGLGDVHDHLTTFVKQHYLTKKTVIKPTVDGGTENIPFYGMGARSILEIGERQILELMSKVTGTTVDPTDILALEEQESQGPSDMATQEN